MEPIWIAIAFALGWGVRQIGLPPLIGFLAAGFILEAFDLVEDPDTLREIGDAGVTLLLFSIGLKLQLRTLARPEVWGTATGHMLTTSLVLGALVLGLGAIGTGLMAGLDMSTALLVGFALSFSSTVFAVKVLEEKGESATLHGRVAIGILIVPDLVAVVFLAASTGKLPTVWALTLLGLPLLRPVLYWILDRSGHGELLVLLGLLMAIAGAAVFELVGLKADLGAIVVGVLLASHAKASELAKALLGFKDLFLVAFFLGIGLYGPPDLASIGVAVLLAVLVPFKVGLFFLLLTRLRLRARTAMLSSLSLANYSEFGLIVGYVGYDKGWIGEEWLVIIALALSITFVVASPLNTHAYGLYARVRERLLRLQTEKRLPDDELVDPGDARVVIFGMGRVGSGAYDVMRTHYGDAVLGVDVDTKTIETHVAAGRNVVRGDATDLDFWERVRGSGHVELVLLALSDHQANLDVARILADTGFQGKLAATARYADEIEELKRAGVDTALDLFDEAGAGFANHVCEELGIESPERA
ncbi:MAG: cation:proton antiporter domain-containing protein [Planctomycetota bacterium]|jgi:predicted Kef-type K+ transport protein